LPQFYDASCWSQLTEKRNSARNNYKGPIIRSLRQVDKSEGWVKELESKLRVGESMPDAWCIRSKGCQNHWRVQPWRPERAAGSQSSSSSLVSETGSDSQCVTLQRLGLLGNFFWDPERGRKPWEWATKHQQTEKWRFNSVIMYIKPCNILCIQVGRHFMSKLRSLPSLTQA
jgi:hypothetical protein